ncbi:MAG TPA: RluA family pseudouridine synthase [Candidatus Kapabacteria bacterium]|nr:RluA family pseudouridine synthase [Candidatus Kapabacteria bacterium]
MTHEQSFIIPEDAAGTRLDVFLSRVLSVTRSKAQQLIKGNRILVNDKFPKKAGDMLSTGATVVILPAVESQKEEKSIETVPPLGESGVRIVAETPSYLVVYKPAGILVHETEAREPVTLLSILEQTYPEIRTIGESELRGGIVHRLDREASGLLVIPRTEQMFLHLKQQFQERTIEKEYLVLVHDAPAKDQDVIDFPIDRGSDGRMVARPKSDVTTVHGVATLQPGKDALTEFTVEKRFARFTLLRVRIHTGRMHQIRVHMLAYNLPVVGDTLYFNKKLNRKRDTALGRLFLHATRLSFTDLDGERQTFEYPLPSELASFLETLSYNTYVDTP